MTYKKATAEVVLFDNSDVITTSCEEPGWYRGNNCPNTSGDCSGQSWKGSSVDAWRAARESR